MPTNSTLEKPCIYTPTMFSKDSQLVISTIREPIQSFPGLQYIATTSVCDTDLKFLPHLGLLPSTFWMFAAKHDPHLCFQCGKR